MILLFLLDPPTLMSMATFQCKWLWKRWLRNNLLVAFWIRKNTLPPTWLATANALSSTIKRIGLLFVKCAACGTISIRFCRNRCLWPMVCSEPVWVRVQVFMQTFFWFACVVHRRFEESRLFNVCGWRKHVKTAPNKLFILIAIRPPCHLEPPADLPTANEGLKFDILIASLNLHVAGRWIPVVVGCGTEFGRLLRENTNRNNFK